MLIKKQGIFKQNWLISLLVSGIF